MPIGSAPAATRRATTRACASGAYANAGQAAVVGRPATSMLSLTANGSAVERQALARGPALLQRPRVVQHALARRQRDPHRVIAAGRDAREHLVDDVGGRQLSVPVLLRQRRGVEALHRCPRE